MRRLLVGLSLFTALSILTPLLPSAVVQAAVPATVTVSAEKDVATRLGPQPGVFKLTRAGDISSALSLTFSLGGTAVRDTDYVLASQGATSTSISFDPGADTTRLAILPQNSTGVASGDLSVTLTLQAGSGYSVGNPSTASIKILDFAVAGSPGVWTPRDADASGTLIVAPQVRYLEAHVAPATSSLDIYMQIDTAAAAPLSAVVYNVAIFVDTDPTRPGDLRVGDVRGQKYRIDASVSGYAPMMGMPGMFNGQYNLRDLAADTSACATSLSPVCDDLLHNGRMLLSAIPFAVQSSGQQLLVQVPLASIGYPTSADVFAMSHLAGANVTTLGEGQRAPMYGALNTTTQHIVLREPSITQHLIINRATAAPNDAALYLTSSELWILAGQFQIQLNFNRAFSVNDPMHAAGPVGEIKIDSDRQQLTGAWMMGGVVPNDIPTWGGDIKLAYDFGAQQGSGKYALLQYGVNGAATVFGQGLNDGLWRATGVIPGSSLGSGVVFAGSISMLDAVVDRQSVKPAGNPESVRQKTDGRWVVQFENTFGALTIGRLPDHLADGTPAAGSALDTGTGQVLAPATLTGTAASASNPNAAADLAQMKYSRVDAQVSGGNLLVKGTLNHWVNTDTSGIFHVYLNTVANETTGLYPSPQGSSMPVDAYYRFDATDGGIYAVGGPNMYYGRFFGPDGMAWITDATLSVHPAGAMNTPGYYIISLPLAAIGKNLGPQLRLQVDVANNLLDVLASTTDVAPVTPLLVPLSDNVIATTTVLSCAPASINVTDSTNCQATVNNATPGATASGAITFAAATGTLSAPSCQLVSGSCSVKYTPSAAGSPLVTAAYPGDIAHAASNAAVTLTVLQAPILPAAPSNLRIGTITANSIQVLWNDNSNSLASFDVASVIGGSNAWTITSVPAGTTGWTHTGLVSGATYWYQVRACNAVGCTPWSPMISGQTTLTAPSAPLNLRLGTVTPTSVQIQWDDTATNATYINIEYWLVGGSGWNYAQVAGTVSSWTQTGLGLGDAYWYGVQACNAAGCSDWTPAVYAQTF